MAQYNIGDVISDCINDACMAKGSVIFRGNNEAICNSCATVFEIEEETAPPPAKVEIPKTPPPPAPKVERKPDPPPPIPRQEKVEVGDWEKHNQPNSEPTTPIPIGGENFVKKKELNIPDVGQLEDPNPDPEALDDVKSAREMGKDAKISDYIFKTRAWRWAHELHNNGNPYRKDSRLWVIFDTIATTEPTTVLDVFQRLQQQGKLGTNLNYLISMYEVVTQCVSAGLLFYDKQTQKLTVCHGTPKPAPTP